MAAKNSGKPGVTDAAEVAAIDQQERVSFGNYGGATRQKVELQPLIDKLIADVRRVDEDEALSRSEKTKRIGRLADSLKVKLYEDKRRKDDDKLKPSSYRRYLTTVRKAITAQNWRHHGLETAVGSLAKHHPRYAEQLHALLDLPDITSIRMAHRDLLTAARQNRDDAAFEAFTHMKLDHEVMRHLTLPAATAAQLATSQVEALEQKATNTVEINYHWLIETINELLTKAEIRSDGQAAQNFSSLALGLALATGRREIEILKQARFEKVGEFELQFSGQAKRRGGVDYGQSYRIYTLISADLVLESFANLRAMPEVLELQHLDNTAVNQRVAKTLNTATKRVFKDEARVFKDSRAIWARVVFELYFSQDPRWKTVNETVFWREMLGHEDMDTQESYKAFKISYTTQADAQVESKFASRLEALEALDNHEQIEGRDAMRKIHSWVKSAVAAAPNVTISQKAIATNVGSYRPVIKEYLQIAGEALATPNRPARAIAPVVPAEVAKAKPRISVHEAGGRWTAVAKVNGVEVARGEGDSKESAYDALVAMGSDNTRH
ncbi:protelomerase family protein [Pseudomonas syringae]|uniref:protelomerase family protein n=1 Tax=Pseudomonas syringae TaxID=317 RepID=UPI001010FD3D|nr:protelomerase family protein [Pseudomonas syringae]